MPAMADITVKKNDGVTNIVYAAKVPSSGDDGSAMWKSDAAVHPYTGLKPEVRMRSRYTGDRKKRISEIIGTYLSYATDTTTGVSSARGGVKVQLTVTVDQEIAQADIDEGISQLTNFIVDPTTIRVALKQGYAPT